MADQLKGEFAGQTIRIVGHTDTDPIKKRVAEHHHLGFERSRRDEVLGEPRRAESSIEGALRPERPQVVEVQVAGLKSRS